MRLARVLVYASSRIVRLFDCLDDRHIHDRSDCAPAMALGVRFSLSPDLVLTDAFAAYLHAAMGIKQD